MRDTRSCRLPTGGVWLLAAGGFLIGVTALATDAPAVPMYALVVGGGPDVENNAAQIEGHVKFVAGLLSPAAKRLVLFADGKPAGESVTYADPGTEAEAEQALDILLADHDADEPVLHRPPKLEVPVDGPARAQDFQRCLGKLSALAAKQPGPLLLYFAGHGSRDEKNDRFTHYDFWGGEKLMVSELASEISHLPRPVPVVLVMAQCFSGAFADVIFSSADPGNTVTDRNIAGFFSTQRDREASGCSYATGRADYQDFSSYFFGALSGRDRFGELVTGADYDGDGTVSLHEAFCYALIHDLSADTPVCTSDVFLSRKAVQPRETIYRSPYKEVWQAGTPAQRAVLDALSERLGLSGGARALSVFDRLTYGDPAARPESLRTQDEAKARLNSLRQKLLGEFLTRWPALRWGERETDAYKRAFDGAVEELIGDEANRHALLEARKVQEQADDAVDAEEAALVRFASMYEHLVEARELRGHGRADIQTRFEKLWQAEQNRLPLATRP